MVFKIKFELKKKIIYLHKQLYMANIEFNSTNARMPMAPTSESYGSTSSGSNRLANTLENEI